MELHQIEPWIKKTESRLTQLERVIEPEKLQLRLSELEQQIEAPGFWQSPGKEPILDERTEISELLAQLQSVQNQYKELIEIFELMGASDELLTEAELLDGAIAKLHTKAVLGGPYDKSNAYVAINSGAGGTESQDWGQMLLRMVIRYAENSGWSATMLDYQAGSEAGLKSAAVYIKGRYAYGKLKCENGIHRLVRISPFDANARRHTSFASIYVTPEIPEEKIVLNPTELRIDTFRASGAGGQHVNTTESAVRITHIPTGIVATCQNERSQGQNKAAAMKMLFSRLVAHNEEEKRKAANSVEKKKIEWGSQIRSYVLHPYKMVKDHRTEAESPQPEKVLDGDLEMFIQAELIRAAEYGE